MDRRTLLTAGVGLLASVTGGCLGDEEEEPTQLGTGEHDGPVVVVGPDHEHDSRRRFEPETLEIEAGETVEFYWNSNGHSFHVTEQPEGGELETIEETHDEGFHFTHTFEEPGRYEYECHIHFGMSGSTVVE